MKSFHLELQMHGILTQVVWRPLWFFSNDLLINSKRVDFLKFKAGYCFAVLQIQIVLQVLQTV